MKKRIANWGNYPVMEATEQTFVFDQQLHALLKDQAPFIPRGSGLSYGDSSIFDRTISTLKFDKVLSFDKISGVFECQPGVTLSQVLDVIVPQGWFLPVTPGTKLITVGGAVGSNVHGKNHRNAGSFSNHVVDIDILLPADELITCSPDNNADLFYATCGGMGLTGMITRVKFRLKKIETAFIKQKQIKARNLDELLLAFDKYANHEYTVAWIDCLTKGDQSGRGIVTVGDHAKLTDLNDDQCKKPLSLSGKGAITFPFYLPSWVLNKFTVKAFNLLFFNKQVKNEVDAVVPYDPFFYPLDAIHCWNRMYGKAGFVQYQFVLPLEAKEGLKEVLLRISEKGMGSFLTVLKVLGKEESMISFCREGYTLALDFPLRPGVLEFLSELDEIVLKYKGRLYIAKDARMSPEMLEHGYPQLNEYKAIIKKYNPSGRIRSLQSDRLHLNSPYL